MKCANASPTMERRGVLSLVFKAWDVIEENYVAIKFMDPSFLSDPYRLEAFHREPDVVRKLESGRRCLNLRSGLKEFQWELKAGDVVIDSFALNYFVVDWIEKEIDGYFNFQDTIEAEHKLEIFKLICLAVAAIHSREVHHRDVKKDNLRQCHLSDDISLIDFGTAARLDSPLINEVYPEPVGATAYSAPEAQCGLKSCRTVGSYTDVYALGCILYELFNQEYFYTAQNRNPYFTQLLIMMSMELSKVKNEQEKLTVWSERLARLRQTLEPAAINLSLGHSIPSAILAPLIKLHRSLTAFDFTHRENDIGNIIRQTDICIKILQNHKLDVRRRRRKAIFVKNRNSKLETRRKKLIEYLKKKEKSFANS